MPWEYEGTDSSGKHLYKNVPWGYPDPEWYSMGKFDSELTERLYEESLEGWWESIGSVDSIGYFTKVDLDLDVILALHIAHFHEAWSNTFNRLAEWAIIGNDDRGFVWLELFWQQSAIDERWEELQEAERLFYICEECEGTGWGKAPNGTMGNTVMELRPDAAPCKGCDGEGSVLPC
jgi:hypothetical protein